MGLVREPLAAAALIARTLLPLSSHIGQDRYPAFMTEPMVLQVQQWLREHEQELLDDYRSLLQIPSIEAEAEPNAPFGRANREALDFVLRRGYEWGMSCKDLEGYCGYAEFGSGESLVAVFGHLDVVPVGPGWKHDPFSATIEDGFVYARGAVDDKGPTIAAYFAARAVKECMPDLGVRMRVVFGCDEESGFECIHRYNQTEEAPKFGFAPDAGWPLIHAEKGIANLGIVLKPAQGSMSLISLDGGDRPNIVIDLCTARVKVEDAARSGIEGRMAEAWDRNVEWTWDGPQLVVTALGKAAHGAWPIGGDSAATRAVRFLMEVAPDADKDFYTELLELTQISGAGLGIDGRDEVSEELTNNLGVVKTEGGIVRMTFNVRYPVTWTGETVRDRCIEKLSKLKGAYTLTDFSDSKPLYFPLDHPLVKTVCDAYVAETGDTKAPGVMGGGTYARAVPNTVAIGTGWIGDGEAHQTNERCAIDSLFKMSRIYGRILVNLAHH